MDLEAMAAGDLVGRLVVSRRWIAVGLAATAFVTALFGAVLLLTRDREEDAGGGPEVDEETDAAVLPDGAELIDIDDDGVHDFLVFNGELTDIRPDSTVSTAWIAGISAIVSAVLTAGVSLVVALLGRNDRQALEELGRRIEEHTHPEPAAA